MKKPRKLSVIREDIAFHRQWIRRLEGDGSDPKGLAKARERFAELEAEEARATKKAATVRVVPPEDPDHDSRGEPRVAGRIGEPDGSSPNAAA